jgi:uncharacterized protein (TIGR03032 family)
MSDSSIPPPRLTGADDSPERPVFELNASRGFESWLAACGVSIAFTTYQLRKIFLLGRKPDGRLWVFNRDIGRCLGLAVFGSDLWVTGDAQIYRFRDAMREGSPCTDGPDALYVPQVAYFTGDLDIHDIAVTENGEVVFANTRFNCLATVSQTHSFKEIWRPPFISRLAAEDRCHLNGLAVVDGRAKYVTCISASDTFDGWRDHRADGGVVLDTDSGEIVCAGLSMPHSPRWQDRRLWLLNSGTGELGWVDPASRSFRPLCFCPGYLRGLAFVANRFALVGLSKPRENKTFSGLPLDAALKDRKVSARCGFYVIDTASGDVVHSVTIEGVATELYEVAVLPHIRQPAMIGLASEEQKRTISVE